MPIKGMPAMAAKRETSVTAAFIPGLSPPLVNTAIFFIFHSWSCEYNNKNGQAGTHVLPARFSD
jgi:hypothetical protein